MKHARCEARHAVVSPPPPPSVEASNVDRHRDAFRIGLIQAFFSRPRSVATNTSRAACNLSRGVHAAVSDGDARSGENAAPAGVSSCRLHVLRWCERPAVRVHAFGSDARSCDTRRMYTSFFGAPSVFHEPRRARERRTPLCICEAMSRARQVSLSLFFSVVASCDNS